MMMMMMVVVVWCRWVCVKYDEAEVFLSKAESLYGACKFTLSQFHQLCPAGCSTSETFSLPLSSSRRGNAPL